MSNLLDRVLTGLDNLTPGIHWGEGVADLLRSEPIDVGAVVAYLDSRSAEERRALFDGSHSVVTHFKWLVHRCASSGYTLWLHEYKTNFGREAGFANVPHNHRYDMASRLLQGAYTVSEWDLRAETLVQKRRSRVVAGEVWHLDHTTFHRLDKIQDGTMTLYVEGRRRRGYSQAFYPGESTPRVFPDFDSRWEDMHSRYAARP